MGRLELPNVCLKRGRPYFRRKVAGRDTYVALPALDSPDFAAAYQMLAKPDTERAKPAPRSVAALVEKFRSSAEFRQTRPSTRANRQRYLDLIAREHGHRSVSGMRPYHLYTIRDAHSDYPGRANNLIAVWRLLMAYAARLDWRADNPASGIGALKLGEHEPWPAELIEVALEVATPMTRLAIVTGLCSGQRISDAIRMQHGWHDGEIMQFEQRKTGAVVAIPMHPLWLEEVSRLPRRSTTLLYDRFGRPFQSTGTLQARIRDVMAHKRVRDTIEDLFIAGRIEEDATFSFHGLRKNACCALLECGANESEVGAILGMSPEMVRHYGKRKRVLMIARGAAQRIAGGNILSMPGGTQKNAAR